MTLAIHQVMTLPLIVEGGEQVVSIDTLRALNNQMESYDWLFTEQHLKEIEDAKSRVSVVQHVHHGVVFYDKQEDLIYNEKIVLEALGEFIRQAREYRSNKFWDVFSNLIFYGGLAALAVAVHKYLTM